MHGHFSACGIRRNNHELLLLFLSHICNKYVSLLSSLFIEPSKHAAIGIQITSASTEQSPHIPAEAQSLCHPNPCQGGGTCEEHDGVFTCYCPEGLTGSRCQHDVTKTNISVASFVGESLVGVITPGKQISNISV